MNQDEERKLVELYVDPDNQFSFSSIKQFHNYIKSIGYPHVTRTKLSQLLKQNVPVLTVEKERQERFIRR